jgi:heme exporter protein C
MLGSIAAGFLWAPRVGGLGDETYVMYFHVPMAWVGGLAYLVSAFYAIKYLARRRLADDTLSAASAELGLLFTFLATVTGALWARSKWGAYWNWDPKQTSIFLLMLTYGAYFMLRSAVPDPDRRATLSAVYALLAAVAVPFLMLIIPRFVVVSALHPSPVVDREVNRKIGMVLMGSNLAFTVLYVWMLQLRARLQSVAIRKESVL